MFELISVYIIVYLFWLFLEEPGKMLANFFAKT